MVAKERPGSAAVSHEPGTAQTAKFETEVLIGDDVVCPALLSFVQTLHDELTDAERDDGLAPLLSDLLGTQDGYTVARVEFLAVRAVAMFAADALERVGGEELIARCRVVEDLAGALDATDLGSTALNNTCVRVGAVDGAEVVDGRLAWRIDGRPETGLANPREQVQWAARSMAAARWAVEKANSVASSGRSELTDAGLREVGAAAAWSAICADTIPAALDALRQAAAIGQDERPPIDGDVLAAVVERDRAGSAIGSRVGEG